MHAHWLVGAASLMTLGATFLYGVVTNRRVRTPARLRIVSSRGKHVRVVFQPPVTYLVRKRALQAVKRLRTEDAKVERSRHRLSHLTDHELRVMIARYSSRMKAQRLARLAKR